MSAEVCFLNVGWGDSHLIRLPSGSVTLIDGGDGFDGPGQDHPQRWLERHGIDSIDWMVLTHLHEDHLNGLIAVAEATRIKRALLPYEPFPLPPASTQTHYTPLATQMRLMLEGYLALIERLREQGTEIQWRSRFASYDEAVVWEEDGVRFAQLYPWQGDSLPAQRILMELADAAELSNDALMAFFQQSNHDSSVYRLSLVEEPECNVLFGGDQLEPGWEQLAARTTLACTVLKVPHHGLEDAFNARLLSWMRPAHCVIPIESARSAPYAEEWNRLAELAGTSISLTSRSTYGLTFRLESGSRTVVQANEANTGR